MLRFGVGSLGSGLGATLLQQGDTLLAGRLMDASGVAAYNAAKMLFRAFNALAQAVNQVLMPLVSRLEAAGRQDDLRVLYEKSVCFLSLGLWPLCLLLVAVANPLLDALFAGRYADSVLPLQILVASALTLPLATIGSSYLVGLGHLRSLTWMTWAGVAIALALAAAWIPSAGPSGAAAATLVAAVFGLVVRTAALQRRLGFRLAGIAAAQPRRARVRAPLARQPRRQMTTASKSSSPLAGRLAGPPLTCTAAAATDTMRWTVPKEARVTYAIVLLEDLGARHGFDLAAAVRTSRRGRLAVVVEAEAGEAGPATALPGGDGAALAAASAASFGAPVAPARFRVRLRGREASGTPAVHAAEALEAMVQKAGPALVVVGFVSGRTLPLWEALHGDPRTQTAPKIGVTTPHLDANWSLAQKLLADGKLSVHEHSMTLERILGRRIDLLLSRHASRGVPGSAGG